MTAESPQAPSPKPALHIIAPCGPDPERVAAHLRRLIQLHPDASLWVSRATNDSWVAIKQVTMDVLDPSETTWAMNDDTRTEAQAVNAAIRSIRDRKLDPADFIAVVSDRVVLTATAIDRMIAAIGQPKTITWDGDRLAWPRGDASVPIVLVGPMGSELDGLQSMAQPIPEEFSDRVMLIDVIDHDCFVLPAQAVFVLAPQATDSVLDDDLSDEFAIRDLCVRLDQAGVGVGMAAGAWVGGVESRFVGSQRNRDSFDRADYYDKHALSGDPKLVVGYRVRLEVPNDLNLFRASLARASRIADSIVVVLTSNPLEVVESDEWKFLTQRKAVHKDDMKLMKACDDGDELQVGQAMRDWIKKVLRQVKAARVVDAVVRVRAVRVWNERDDRNYLLKIARETESDWFLSIDHDEMLEDRVSNRMAVERLMLHPDPIVSCWDVGRLHHWDSESLVRQDRPWGHNGNYREGAHAIRMYRLRGARKIIDGNAIGLHCAHGPPRGPHARRISSIRLRHFGYARRSDRERKLLRNLKLDPVPDPKLNGVEGHDYLLREESMLVSKLEPVNGIGLHMLVWEGEDIDDVARWLDVLHGVVDGIVLVWTGAWEEGDKAWTLFSGSALRERVHSEDEDSWADWFDTGPDRDLARIAAHHGVKWVHEPLNDDLATARNAGVEVLDQAQSMGWALFFDPDEWLDEPEDDCRALRSMAEAGARFGYLFDIANHRGEGKSNTSESVRMSRLDSSGIMRFDGRVHEGFRLAQETLRASGNHPNLGRAPFILQHRWMDDPVGVVEKLDKYARLLLLDLEDDSRNPGAWVSLAWHYRNNGHDVLAVECFQRAVACAGTSFLPFRELGLHHLRIARAMMRKTAELLVPSHPYYRLAGQIVQFLETYAPSPEVIPHRQGEEPLPLPMFALPSDPSPSESRVQFPTPPSAGWSEEALELSEPLPEADEPRLQPEHPEEVDATLSS